MLGTVPGISGGRFEAVTCPVIVSVGLSAVVRPRSEKFQA